MASAGCLVYLFLFSQIQKHSRTKKVIAKSSQKRGQHRIYSSLSPLFAHSHVISYFWIHFVLTYVYFESIKKEVLTHSKVEGIRNQRLKNEHIVNIAFFSRFHDGIMPNLWFQKSRISTNIRETKKWKSRKKNNKAREIGENERVRWAATTR